MGQSRSRHRCIIEGQNLATATVMIGKKPAARVGDTTAHGGAIVVGVPNVMIGG